MTQTAANDLFDRMYADRAYRYPTMVRHNGTVLAFAMDADRRIHYTALDVGPGSAADPVDADHWSPNPQPLAFATELASVGFGVADQVQLPAVRLGSSTPVPAGQPVRPDELDAFLSSTARFTADAPFQVLSDGGYLYVFRQAITDPRAEVLEGARRTLVDRNASADDVRRARGVLTDHANMVYAADAAGRPQLDLLGRQIPLVAGTLLVDRFALVGTTLEAKLEARFQRSRSRTRPAGTTDSLGAADLDKRPFVEPTQNLRFVPVSAGRFSAVLVPTQVADVFRWQIFAHDPVGDLIRSVNLARTPDGLFDTLGDPAATGTGIAAGTALSFPTDGRGAVTLNGARATGTEFTVEAWLRPDPAATGERALLTCAGDPRSAGPSVWLPDPTSLRIGFGDGSAFHQVTTPALLAPGQWNHLAISYAAGLLQVYVDGQIAFYSRDLNGALPNPTPVAALGAPTGGYAGQLDDVRIWSVALAAADVDAGRHTTLTGLEAGLVGYWRLDEGDGTATWDAASSALGLLDGPTWVTSDAPIGEAAGLRRTAIRFADRIVAGGLGATLYYQQETATSGYPGSPPAPLKQAARVMLAVVTSVGGPPVPGGTAPALVTAVDFGVGVDGGLSRVPGQVRLTELDLPGAGPGTGADVLARVLSAKADVAAAQQALTDDTAALTAATAAADAIDAVLAGRTPGPVPAGYPQIAATVTDYAAKAAHLFALQHSSGAERRLLDQLMAETTDAMTADRQKLSQPRAELTARIADLSARVTADQAALAVATTNLAALEHLLNGDTVLPMPLLQIDAAGLVTTGAVLGFAPAVDSPVLLDGGLGRVTLYFRDATGNFLLAYYDTFTGRAARHLPADTGDLLVVAKSAAAELDQLTVTVAPGPDDASCVLTVTLPGDVPVTETWDRLPRDADTLAAVLNGTAQPVFLATATAAAGTVDTLTLTTPLRVPVPAGALIAAGDVVLIAAERAERGAGSIAVRSRDLAVPGNLPAGLPAGLAEGTELYRIGYDPSAATSTRPGTDLRRGSRLIGVDARAASGAVHDGTAASLGPTPSSHWFAAPPGTTIDFDGTTTRAGVQANTALRLNGSSAIQLHDPAKLDVTGAITIEAWVRPVAASTSFADIVARGFVDTADQRGEVYLRIVDNTFQIGSWNGTDHAATAPVPPGDYGTWVHLAGVHDGTAWRLYRNGLLLASTPDKVGAVPVAAGWAVGSTADGRSRFFTGDVDDVRIWSRALGPQEITDGMTRRLTGAEAGLVGYFTMQGGTLVDHTPAPADVTLVGAPRQTTSPPPLAHLDGFDVTGDVSVETWLNPIGTGLNRVLVHRSDVCRYGLALRQRSTALHLDGTAGHLVRLPDVPALNLTGVLTMEAWIRPQAATDGLRDVLAHGYSPNPQAEVYLRIAGDSYQVGSWTGAGTDVAATATIPAEDVGRWVHLAGTFDGMVWNLYRDGILLASRADFRGAPAVPTGWTIGNSAAGDRPFLGDLDDVRLWSVARTGEELLSSKDTQLTGGEPGLVGAWRYDGQVMRDLTAAGRDGTVTGLAAAGPGPHPAYSVVATVGDQAAETVRWLPGRVWSHVAATFEQFYGLQLDPGGYLDAGSGSGLNLSRDLTVEAGVRIDDLSVPNGVIGRGVLEDGTDDDVPYSLSVQTDGSLVFAFEDKEHRSHRFVSDPHLLAPGQFRRIAVTRRHNVQVDTTDAGTKGGSAVVSAWDDITFYADGAQVGRVQRYDGPDVGSSQAATLIGRATGPSAAGYGLRGALGEVRLWSKAVEAPVIGSTITGTEVGLVAWWRLQEGTGNVAADSKGRQHATVHGPVRWVHTPDGRGSQLVVYLDGVPATTSSLDPATLTAAEPQFTLGALNNARPGEFFAGQLEELRVWRTTRTGQEIRDNLFGRLTGESSDLVAYYPFSAGALLEDHGPRGNDVVVAGGSWILSTAPIGEDTPLARNAVLGLRTRFDATVAAPPAAAEYALLETTAAGGTHGVLKRAYGYVDDDGGWHLVTGFKVGELATSWVGQAQFAPQLIGYLEGAPPVPSENLTVQDSYAGATSVALTEATSTTYTYASSRDSGFNASFELSIGQGAQQQTYLGLMAIEAPLGIGVGELTLVTGDDVAVTVSGKATFETSLSWLNDTSSGQGTTRSRVSTLSLTGGKEAEPAVKAMGPRFVPDNIGFALVQSQTADVYALRLLHTGALVAYQMMPNPDIPKDYNVITFPIDPHYTKQGVLDGRVGLTNDVDYPNASTASSDLSYFKPIEAYGLKAGIERQEQELATRYAQHDVDPNQLSGGRLPGMTAPLKRDLVNTYVWTADGGQFAETVTTLDTYSESVGGAYHFQGMAGGTLSADVSVFGVAVNVELSAMFGGHLDLSVTRTRDSQRSFEVDVVAGGEQEISSLDDRGRRVRTPGKVDAYRWLTFYLSPRSDNYDAFFGQVVDPIWLAQSGDPAAVALRQARQDGKRPPAWRVLHRVTYVSRVLPPLEAPGSPAGPSLEQALAALDIASNYELIRTLEPFVRGRTGSYPAFTAAVRAAVASYLPDLTAHLDQIIGYLVLYYGVTDAPQLAGP